MERGATHTGDGDLRRVRQDELDLVEPLPSPPVLDGARPAVARVAEAVGEDDGRRVLPGGREHERGRAADGRRHVSCYWWGSAKEVVLRDGNERGVLVVVVGVFADGEMCEVGDDDERCCDEPAEREH